MSENFTVEVDNLYKTYREGFFGRKRFEALKGISFKVRQGEVFGLLGPNGAGKTTFLKILLGIIAKTSGQATMLGEPAGSLSARKQVGYLPEHLRIPRHLTALSALELYGNLCEIPSSVVRSRRDELLSMVGLLGREKERVKNFSKGMLQRLGIAQALLNKPQLLIMDEPTDGLDPRARAEVRSLIMRLKGEGVTVFVNSHILQEIELICDRVCILDKGNLRYLGAVDEAGEKVRGASEQFSVELSIDVAAEKASSVMFPEGVALVRSNPLPNGGTEFEVIVANQRVVDESVDAVRRQGLSLIGLRRKRASLEEAFLAILDETPANPNEEALHQ